MAPQLVGLAIVFGLLALWAAVMRRGGHLRWLQPFLRPATPQANPLLTAASLNLTPQHRLHVVVYQQRQFLVLTGPGVGVMLNWEEHSSFLPAFNAALTRQEPEK